MNRGLLTTLIVLGLLAGTVATVARDMLAGSDGVLITLATLAFLAAGIAHGKLG